MMHSEEFWLIWFPSMMAALVILLLYAITLLYG